MKCSSKIYIPEYAIIIKQHMQRSQTPLKINQATEFKGKIKNTQNHKKYNHCKNTSTLKSRYNTLLFYKTRD